MKIPSSVTTIIVVAVILIAGAVAVILATPRTSSQTLASHTPGVLLSATNTLAVTKSPLPTSIPLTPGTPMPAALLRVWNSMCVEGVPYTLFSVPPDAKFSLVQAQAKVSMTAIPLTGITPIPSAIPTYSTPSFVGGTAGPLPTATFTPQAASGTASNNGSLGVVPGQNSCTALGQMNGLQMVMCTGPEGSLFTVYVQQASAAQLYQGYLWDCTAPTATSVTATAVTGTLVPSLVPTVLNTPQPTTPATTVPPTVQPTLPPPTSTPPPVATTPPAPPTSTP